MRPYCSPHVARTLIRRTMVQKCRQNRGKCCEVETTSFIEDGTPDRENCGYFAAAAWLFHRTHTRSRRSESNDAFLLEVAGLVTTVPANGYQEITWKIRSFLELYFRASCQCAKTGAEYTIIEALPIT